jgi:hypothetical protein
MTRMRHCRQTPAPDNTDHAGQAPAADTAPQYERPRLGPITQAELAAARADLAAQTKAAS